MTNIDDEINDFAGEYKFLSNFYLHPIMFNGIDYPSSENAFQAQKSLDKNVQLEFQSITPNRAKQKGRQLKMRDGWNSIKNAMMRSVIRKKFQDHGLRQKLLATGDRILVEGNWWGDEYWGRCNGVGENWLGKILMEEREAIRNKESEDIEGRGR